MSKPDFPRQEGPWVIHGEEALFDNPWIALQRYDVTQPNSGNRHDYTVIRFKNIAVGVLPIDDEGNTWIVGQHRFALGRYSWELPEGGGARNLAPEETAARELEEECGLKAQKFLALGYWHTSNSVTDEEAYAFIATGLHEGAMAPDESEVLSVRKLPFAELLGLVTSGEITDAFTVLMVQNAYIKAHKGDLPPEVAQLLLR